MVGLPHKSSGPEHVQPRCDRWQRWKRQARLIVLPTARPSPGGT